MRRADAQTMVNAALELARYGWRVHPVNGKKPILPDWPALASTDPETIREWWDHYHDANVGIAAGAASNLVVVDVDRPRENNPADGMKNLRALADQHGGVPKTVVARTGRGGWHIYFTCPPDGPPIKNSTAKLCPGVDVKAERGSVVAPPSIHPDTGKLYTFLEGKSPHDRKVAPLPQWLHHLILQTQEEPAPLNGNGVAQGDGPILEGGRNVSLTSHAGFMRKQGYSPEIIEAALLAMNRAIVSPPLSNKEVRGIAASTCRYPCEPGRPAFPTDVFPPPIEDFVLQAATMFPCPPDFIAVPLLVALGAAIGRTRIVTPKDDWHGSARLWAAIVAKPGELKSPALDIVSTWLRKQQAEYDVDYREEKKEYERALIEREIALKRWKESKAKNKLTEAEKRDGPPEKPDPPAIRKSIVTDLTMEVLGKILEDNPRGVVLWADELSGWTQGIGQYKQHGGADRKHWLSIWSHQQLTVDRLTRDPLSVPRPFVSVVGGIQPESLKDLDPEQGMRDGFIHRILMVEPEPVEIRYSRATISQEAMRTMENVFGALHALEPDKEKLKEGKYEPQTLDLAEDAELELETWFNQHCREPQHSDFPPLMEGPWAKLRGYSLSLALILALAENPQATRIERAPMMGAISLIEGYFKPHLMHVYQRMTNRKRTPFSQCRDAILRALGQGVHAYKDLRQAIGGRFEGNLVKSVLEDLIDAGEIAEQPRPGSKEKRCAYALCKKGRTKDEK